MEKIIAKYLLGDMQAIYVLDEENRNPELVLLPSDMAYEVKDREKPYSDSLVQVKIVGDTYRGGYAPGNTLRQSQTTMGLTYVNQDVANAENQTEICTFLQDDRNLKVEHHLIYKKGEKILRSFTVFTNDSREEVTLELLSSFSLGKISPLLEKDGHGKMALHRIRSVWSMEGRKEEIALEDLQLEPSWGGHAVRAERFGQAGSLPVNKYFPMMVLEDKANHIYWGAQLAHNASWQMEVYRRGDFVQISGGLADRELGHWMKKIAACESFTSPTAILSVCQDEEGEEIYRRLTSALDRIVDAGPESEQELPVMFNEYCTTWGNPSHENIKDIVNAIKDKGFAYFVIDCGWYKENGIPWDLSMGDYKVSKELFPDGLDKTVKCIKDAGMKPGIWFEIDNVGEASKAYQMEDHLLQRDGRVFTTTMRRFWDLRQDFVQQYLSEKVIGLLKEYGFEYMKIDCNDTVGIGCDGAESLGEGLRQNQAASIQFIEKVKKEIPGIILENCASGGHKLEPLMLSKCSMASFSDAHECEEIPVIAANLHRVILPRQSQIWAVVHQIDSLKRIAYSVANTFLGRMCISGDVWLLDDAQWKVIEKGIAFYKQIAPIIKYGKSYFFGTTQKAYRHLEGWQGVFRENVEQNAGYIVMHGFDGCLGTEACIQIPKGYQIEKVYSDKDEKVALIEGAKFDSLEYNFTEEKKAVAVYLRKC